MKPIRVNFLDGEGTWIETVTGASWPITDGAHRPEPMAVVVLDNGVVLWMELLNIRVKNPNELKIRAMQ